MISIGVVTWIDVVRTMAVVDLRRFRGSCLGLAADKRLGNMVATSRTPPRCNTHDFTIDVTSQNYNVMVLD